MALLSSLIGTPQFNGKLFKPGALCSLMSLKIVYYSTTHSHIPSVEPSSCSPDNAKDVVDSLISIFTKQPLTPNSPRLNQLAPRITTQVVESVLKGLRSWKIAQMFFNWASDQHGYKHNCYTYNTMASILSGMHQIYPLKVLIKDILNSHCSFTPGALGFLIRCLGSVGLVQEASELFDEIKLMGLCFPNIYSYNCLLEVIAKSGSIDMMEMRLKEMKKLGWQFDKHTLTAIMHACCNHGRFGVALNVFNAMHERGWVDARIYSMLIVSFSKWGKVDKAFELLERMESLDIKLNEKTFCILIHGFVKESHVDKALQLLGKMRKAGFIAAVSVYDALIGGLCKNKKIDKALCLYSEMKELDIRPDAGILTKLLSCSSDKSIIMKLLEEIPEGVNTKILLLLYNAALNGYSSDGLMDEACHLLQSMICNKSGMVDQVDMPFKVKKMIFPDSTSFSIVIDGLLKKGGLDLALGLFNDMQRIACRPNILICNNLINELCKVDRLDESLKLLREMKDLGVEPTHFTYNSIYGCFCQRKDVSGAIAILREMRACGHDPWIKYTTLLVRELCVHKMSLEACHFLSNMVQVGFLPDIVSYTAAIQGLINIHEVDKALELFRDLCSRGYCPDLVAFNILINGLSKLNKLTEVESLLNEIAERGLFPSVATYNMLIDSNCKNGYFDEAMLLFSRMSREGREPSVVTYTTMMDGLCKAGKPDDALVVWNEMGRKGCRPNRIAFMALIHGLCNCCRPTEALQYFREMKQKKLVADQYIHMALLSALLCDLNFPAAFEILREIVDRGLFPQTHDESYLIVRDAVQILSKDEGTSSGIQALIEEGKIPISCLSVVGNQGVP
ncbi:putative pentatricopeptide repeat-containing protein At5g08310, mitochondrial [Neltuma alba]|uniref:putative pentatricopeptide repeat-containing protein At5g08310, mitochondrial n=1 Tax=Neltuma alba TaxID=207710 RepID=UPI0010A2E11D|nr:putative pentatricopeptide repeat-containing protein At5g08310, mitochondrial [Prosopis alba]XP_028803091.1 putative pentatricopeptide repeat-containing protein At5g08310, mitochondrial [Prosopis alba]XP_028803092.1 putative pentatricopeptide repeat-containing protein At5g08310, mitochondrial [Prosopis alba]XP_028803093.1 putative pentatricopeptide repeat-containing protein At5g08310, mitochondrial [Prosopis alba]XP_028803094.1 putative pentatricopeptide repeat-containing protein At5g08310, 